jgi:uncharacterized integral membrane protein
MSPREGTMPQILAALAVVMTGGLFLVGVGVYLSIRFVVARRKHREEDRPTSD